MPLTAASLKAEADITCGAGEARCYLLADQDDLALFLPKAVTREPNCSLLVDWNLMKLVPPDWYRLVFLEPLGLLKDLLDIVVLPQPRGAVNMR